VSLAVAQKDRVKHDGVVVLLVAGAVDERDMSRCGEIAYAIELLAMFLKLAAVAMLELRPPARVVPKPFPERRTGRNFLHPFVDGGLFFTQPTWPKAVYEDPKAIIWFRRFIGALQLEI
jgi:hypothetical protein